MRQHTRWTSMALLLTGLAACSGGGVSGPVGSACMEGGRSAANLALCSCIQSVADQTLSNADQRQAARFFDDPDRAQEVRTSDRPSDDALWDRYRDFTSAATASCG